MLTYSLKSGEIMEKDDLSLLKEYIEFPFNKGDKRSELTSFNMADAVWQWTNEPISKFYDEDLVNKKVLSVTAGGDYILHCVLAGSKDITGFDVNIFSKYFAELKIAMIKEYDFYAFMNKKDILSQNRICDLKELNNVIETMDDNYIEFFMAIENAFKKYYSNIKVRERLGVCLMEEYRLNDPYNLAYYNRESYKKLKTNLQDCNISYLDYSLEEVLELDRNKYDHIYLSNILAWITDKNIALKTLKELAKKLNINRTIYDYALFEESSLSSYFDTIDIGENIIIDYIDSGLGAGKLMKYKRIK